jgi:SAM-dependent methyltransferase
VDVEVLEHYQLLGEETRLASGTGRLEFLRTWDVLSRALPEPPARVLDVGGATGVYAARLAEAGYTVHVVDPVPEHVARSAALPGVTAAAGDARALTEPDASYDAVLLLGPLYHLLDRADRVRAWREAGRVVRPGGLVVGATIVRYASLFDGLRQTFYRDPVFRPIVRTMLATGEHRVPADRPQWFTTAYFHHPDELPAEVADGGLELVRTVVVEGPLWMVGTLRDILADEAATALLLDQLRLIEAEPSLFGASSHLLTLAARPV